MFQRMIHVNGTQNSTIYLFSAGQRPKITITIRASKLQTIWAYFSYQICPRGCNSKSTYVADNLGLYFLSNLSQLIQQQEYVYCRQFRPIFPIKFVPSYIVAEVSMLQTIWADFSHQICPKVFSSRSIYVANNLDLYFLSNLSQVIQQQKYLCCRQFRPISPIKLS